MKLSQKELEMLSSVDIEQLIDDVWDIACVPNLTPEQAWEVHRQRKAIFTMAVSATSGRQRRVIDRLLEESNKLKQTPVLNTVRLLDIKEEIKEAFRGEFRESLKHEPTFLNNIKELFVIQLVAAIPAHPPFPVTYYAGYCLPTKGAAHTHDIDAAARWSAKDEAQSVADKLPPTISCAWKVVEA